MIVFSCERCGTDKLAVRQFSILGGNCVALCNPCHRELNLFFLDHEIDCEQNRVQARFHYLKNRESIGIQVSEEDWLSLVQEDAKLDKQASCLLAKWFKAGKGETS